MPIFATIAAKITTDSSQFNKGIAEAESKIKQAGKSLTDFASLAQNALAGGFVAGVTKAIYASASLEQSISKVEQVFKSNSKAILNWSKDSATALGLSRREALDAAAGFASLLKNQGLTADSATALSVKYVNLASDMAKAWDTSTKDAILAINSGIKGSGEMLDNYGISIKAANIEAEAMRLGLVKNKESLDDAAKTQAQYSLIMKQTADIQGQTAREADSLGARTENLKAEFQNLSDQLAKQLIPVATDVVNAARQMVEWFGKLDPQIQKTVLTIGTLVALSGPIKGLIGLLGTQGLLGALSGLVTFAGGFTLAGIAGAFAVVASSVVAATLVIEDFKMAYEAIQLEKRAKELDATLPATQKRVQTANERLGSIDEILGYYNARNVPGNNAFIEGEGAITKAMEVFGRDRIRKFGGHVYTRPSSKAEWDNFYNFIAGERAAAAKELKAAQEANAKYLKDSNKINESKAALEAARKNGANGPQIPKFTFTPSATVLDPKDADKAARDKKAHEERLYQITSGVVDKYLKLTLSEFEYGKHLLDQEVADYKKAGVEKVLIESYYQEALYQLRKAYLDKHIKDLMKLNPYKPTVTDTITPNRDIGLNTTPAGEPTTVAPDVPNADIRRNAGARQVFGMVKAGKNLTAEYFKNLKDQFLSTDFNRLGSSLVDGMLFGGKDGINKFWQDFASVGRRYLVDIAWRNMLEPAIKGTFDSLSKSISASSQVMLQSSAMILQAAYSLLNIAGQQGKKRQWGSILGGLAGIGVALGTGGAVLPYATAGASLGGAVAGGNIFEILMAAGTTAANPTIRNDMKGEWSYPTRSVAINNHFHAPVTTGNVDDISRKLGDQVGRKLRNA